MNSVIFGEGFVGKATSLILKKECVFHDPYKNIIVDDFSTFDFAIICVPTPGTDSGLDHSEIINCLELLNSHNFSGIKVIRSTCHPEVLHQLSDQYQNVIFWPEFLREKHFDIDAKNPGRVILGGNHSLTNKFAEYLKSKDYGLTVMWSHLNLKESAMIKLGTNFALAAKILTFNALHDACQHMGIHWDTVKNGVSADHRIGRGQTMVPGPDGEFGFGGKCLPKDTKTIEHLVDDKTFVESLLLYNNKLRNKLRT
jgi:UDPglucose 6-dehydrogenase